jgi:sulfur dioxygenase
LRWLLRTHEHDDQIPGEPEALDLLGAPRIQHRRPAGHESVFAFGSEHLRVLSLPDHTAGCLSFLWHDRLFCGGLLAVDAWPWQPQPALPESLWDSVTRQFFTLPAETLLFTGHAPNARTVSNVLEQRRWHPWFAGVNRDQFLARVCTLSPPLTPTAGRTA